MSDIKGTQTVGDSQKPSMVDISVESREVLVARLNEVRKFAALELKSHLTAIERSGNGEVMQTEQLQADHEESVNLATAVLEVIEGGEFTSNLVNKTIDDARSSLRKLKTEWNWVPKTVLSKMLVVAEKEEVLRIMLSLRDVLHPKYEEGFIQSEKFDNGELSLTVADLARANCKRNFCGMIIPKTDSPAFLFSWREGLTEKYRSPERQMDGLL